MKDVQHLGNCILKQWDVQFSSAAQSCPTLWSHELQHSRPSCPSPTPGVYRNPCPLSRWCHPTISSSVVPFSSCSQSFPASRSFTKHLFDELKSKTLPRVWSNWNSHSFLMEMQNSTITLEGDLEAWQFLTKLKTLFLYDFIITLLVIYPNELKNLCMDVYGSYTQMDKPWKHQDAFQKVNGSRNYGIPI